MNKQLKNCNQTCLLTLNNTFNIVFTHTHKAKDFTSKGNYFLLMLYT